MNELNPNQIFQLSKNAYGIKNGNSMQVRRELDIALPFVNVDTLKILNGASGLFTPSPSGFGFMAQLNGGRSTEIVIATRGSASTADVGTDINALPVRGPTGHLVHQGFDKTFKSYVQHLNEFIKQQNLGFKPTAVHCMGHSLGGALANLNAAAFAELGMNAYLYTVAAPRVGMLPYAEHLSKKMNAAHVYRVANESDIVTMVPCFPFVHAPYIHGTYLLDGGTFQVNPLKHTMDNGYKSMLNSTWKQMESLTQGKKQQLENSIHSIDRQDSGYFDKLAATPGAMFSGRLLKLINTAINDMLNRLGAQSLLTVSQYGTGSFTVLDQMAEILGRHAKTSTRRAKEMLGLLNAIMAYLGHAAITTADASVATIRWVFGLLHRSVNTMAFQAINLVGRS